MTKNKITNQISNKSRCPKVINSKHTLKHIQYQFKFLNYNMQNIAKSEKIKKIAYYTTNQSISISSSSFSNLLNFLQILPSSTICLLGLGAIK